MQQEGIIDAIVIVSRWYGGTLLGPARFAHIETCAQEVCRAFKRKEEFEDCITTLSTLDDILVDLRAELASISDSSTANSSSAGAKHLSPKASRQTDYSLLNPEEDLSRVKRLVVARENAIKNLKGLIAKKRRT